MKNFIKIALVVAFGLASTALKAQKLDTLVVHTSAVCDMCEETMQKELAFVSGVRSADLDLKTMDLTVVYKAKKTNEKEIITAINRCGYDAGDSPAIKEAYDNLHSCCKKGAH